MDSNLTLTDWSLCTKAVVNPVSINLRPSAEYLLDFLKSDEFNQIKADANYFLLQNKEERCSFYGYTQNVK